MSLGSLYCFCVVSKIFEFCKCKCGKVINNVSCFLYVIVVEALKDHQASENQVWCFFLQL